MCQRTTHRRAPQRTHHRRLRRPIAALSARRGRPSKKDRAYDVGVVNQYGRDGAAAATTVGADIRIGGRYVTALASRAFYGPTPSGALHTTLTSCDFAQRFLRGIAGQMRASAQLR
jgi:hypothetical protein